jgi:hypothetical protein
MSRLERALAALVHSAAAALPDPRREWAEALLAEARHVPGRTARVRWLAGGLWFLAWQLAVGRIARALAFGVAGSAVVIVGWPGGRDWVVLVSRLNIFVALLMLAVLPFLVGRHFGPVARGWFPRALRVAGYAGVLALTAAKARSARIADTLPQYNAHDPGMYFLHVAYLLVIGSYVAGLLVITSARSPVGPGTVRNGIGIGAITGLALYALAPFGAPWGPSWYAAAGRVSWRLVALAMPLVAGLLAARSVRRSGPGVPSRADPGRLSSVAATCTMATAALLLSVLMSITIALFPHRVPLQTDVPRGGGCETCNPDNTVIPVGLRHEYLVDLSIGQAGSGTGLVLFAAALFGAGLGPIGSALLGPMQMGRRVALARGGAAQEPRGVPR